MAAEQPQHAEFLNALEVVELAVSERQRASAARPIDCRVSTFSSDYRCCFFPEYNYLIPTIPTAGLATKNHKPLLCRFVFCCVDEIKMTHGAPG